MHGLLQYLQRPRVPDPSAAPRLPETDPTRLDSDVRRVGVLRPSRPDPGRPDPGRPDPGRPEPGRPEPGRLEPGRLEPGRLEPGRLEPGRLEPGRLEPGRLEPGRLEPGRLEPGRLEPGRLEPGRLEPGRLEPGRLEPGRLEPGRLEPGRLEPGRLEPGRLEPGRLEPGRLEPGRLEPGRLEPGRLEPGRLEPGRLEPGRLDPRPPEELRLRLRPPRLRTETPTQRLPRTEDARPPGGMRAETPTQRLPREEDARTPGGMRAKTPTQRAPDEDGTRLLPRPEGLSRMRGPSVGERSSPRPRDTRPPEKRITSNTPVRQRRRGTDEDIRRKKPRPLLDSDEWKTVPPRKEQPEDVSWVGNTRYFLDLQTGELASETLDESNVDTFKVANYRPDHHPRNEEDRAAQLEMRTFGGQVKYRDVEYSVEQAVPDDSGEARIDRPDVVLQAPTNYPSGIQWEADTKYHMDLDTGELTSHPLSQRNVKSLEIVSESPAPAPELRWLGNNLDVLVTGRRLSAKSKPSRNRNVRDPVMVRY